MDYLKTNKIELQFYFGKWGEIIQATMSESKYEKQSFYEVQYIEINSDNIADKYYYQNP